MLNHRLMDDPEEEGMEEEGMDEDMGDMDENE